MRFIKEQRLIIIDDNVFIHLTVKEAEIFDILLNNEKEICSFEKFNVILETEKAALRTSINRLNKKVGKYVNITAITNKGYKLVLKEGHNVSRV